jgi:hypothetical protein
VRRRLAWRTDGARGWLDRDRWLARCVGKRRRIGRRRELGRNGGALEPDHCPGAQAFDRGRADRRDRLADRRVDPLICADVADQCPLTRAIDDDDRRMRGREAMRRELDPHAREGRWVAGARCERSGEIDAIDPGDRELHTLADGAFELHPQRLHRLRIAVHHDLDARTRSSLRRVLSACRVRARWIEREHQRNHTRHRSPSHPRQHTLPAYRAANGGATAARDRRPRATRARSARRGCRR